MSTVIVPPSPTFTDVKQTNEDQNITLYPNPSTGLVTVNGISKGDDLKLSSTDGKLIARKIAGSSMETFNLLRNAPGIYIISILTKSGTVQTLKLVKN